MRRLLKQALAVLFCLTISSNAAAENLRVATFNASLNRNGPGILLKDLMSDKDTEIEAISEIIRTVRPDILLINEFDYDATDEAARQFVTRLKNAGPTTRGISYDHMFSAPSNTGLASGMDLDGDGQDDGPRDAFGYGRFPGQYGMLLLSRYPIDPDDSYTFRDMLWRDLPNALLPVTAENAPFPSARAHAILRLSSKSHWDIAVETSAGPLRILAAHPTPPVFDGPEDFNGRRNHDEIKFWTHYLNNVEMPSDQGPHVFTGNNFVILGDMNADPNDGDGLLSAINDLLSDPRLQDPKPRSAGAKQATLTQAGTNLDHSGDPANDTSDWNDENGPGNLRVDFVLPSSGLRVTDAGVFWPMSDEPAHALITASDHRLVWVDIDLGAVSSD